MAKGCPVDSCQRPDESATKAVKHVFEILGVNVDDPQQVENFRKGLRFGEEMLSVTKKGKLAVMISVIGLVTTYIWVRITTMP